MGRKTGKSNRNKTRGRRRFLKLVAGSAAAMAVGAAAAPQRIAAQNQAKASMSETPSPERPEKIETEIANQKAYVAKTLATIRSFELPTGSDLAFRFQALAPGRTERRRSR